MIHATSRRAFLTMAAAGPLALAASRKKHIPIGLELYSVREDLDKDLTGTVNAVAKMGYEVVEFYAPYYKWDQDRAKEVRKLMDDLGIRCNSTHNSAGAFAPDGIQKAIDLNHILGTKYVVMASSGKVEGLDGWKGVAETLTRASETLEPQGLRAGYHNHLVEFQKIDGRRPMEVLAANTPKEVMLQFDVGTCLEAGDDPVAWINANPGRINSMHLKDWAPGEGKGFRVLFGEGAGQWDKILHAAEKTGGVEYYLIEQEGSQYPELETARRCLDNWKKIRA